MSLWRLSFCSVWLKRKHEAHDRLTETQQGDVKTVPASSWEVPKCRQPSPADREDDEASEITEDASTESELVREPGQSSSARSPERREQKTRAEKAGGKPAEAFEQAVQGAEAGSGEARSLEPFRYKKEGEESKQEEED